jgi:hypothetical protein
LIFIDALYINTGGAKIVLESIINQLKNEKKIQNYFFLLDDRIPKSSYSALDKSNYEILRANVNLRKSFYKNNILKYSKIVCLANLPPPISIGSKPVYILFHNAHILQPNLSIKNFISLIKYRLKWLYIFLNNKSSYNWIVQTKTMYNLLNKALFIRKAKIEILPFFNNDYTSAGERRIDLRDKVFCYIADGQSQKNHKFLLEAWKILYESYNINYKLLLTVSDAYPELILQIDNLIIKGLNIENLGAIPYSEVLKLYNQINYLVYPSLIESFGLPLIEAASLGCDIIAIDKNYVSDVILPSKRFSENRVLDLVDIILGINKGLTLPRTEIIIHNRMIEFIELID